MPSIITHHMFGQQVYESAEELIGPSQDCMQAFLLGNQGPDPLFFAAINPSMQDIAKLASSMHYAKTPELIVSLREAIDALRPDVQNVAQAYALGFLCHYLLDSTIHPLVYANQYAISGAGVQGLGVDDGSEIHASIETQYDERVLFMRTGQTIKTYRVPDEILLANEEVLDIIGRMYMYMALMTFNISLPRHTFAKSVKLFRWAQHRFYSPTGISRCAFSRLERLVRRHSMVAALSHHPKARTETPFDNTDHHEWIDPDTLDVRTESFDDLFDGAVSRAPEAFGTFLQPEFSLEDARKLTACRNFVGARIVE